MSEESCCSKALRTTRNCGSVRTPVMDANAGVVVKSRKPEVTLPSFNVGGNAVPKNPLPGNVPSGLPAEGGAFMDGCEPPEVNIFPSPLRKLPRYQSNPSALV